MENERREDNSPEENAPGQPPQYNQPPQGYPPQGGSQGPYPPQQGNYPPPQNYPPQGGQYPNQPPQYNQPPQHYVGKNLYGVGGWLLFLCIILTIIAPVFTVFGLVSTFAMLDEMNVIRNYKEFATISSISGSLIVVFGLIAGLFLWNRWSNAVAIAKTYLIFAMANTLVVNILHMVVVKYPHRPEFAFVYVGIVIGIIVGLGIQIAWFAYLCKSKRVAVTYGKAHSAG